MKRLIAAIAICGLSVGLANAQDDWIAGGVTDGNISITNSHSADVPMLGLDISSSSGGLKANGSGPFTITLLDTPNNVVLGNLGNPFVLGAGASVTTEIGFSGAVGDLTASWGNGTVPTPVSFIIAPALDPGILAPGDAIVGGQSDGTVFTVGVAGTDGGVNNWPAGESPDHTIDGVGQKYLNFGKENTGFIVTPAAGPRSVATGIQFWAANDSPERDPASYQILGTNAAIGGGPFNIADFTEIAAGDLALPASRNDGGDAPLVQSNSVIATFDANAEDFSSYLVLFPTVKDTTTNSMQIAEVQIYGQVVPEPSSSLLAIALLPVALLMRRRRR